MLALSDYCLLFIFVTKEKDGMIMHTLETFICIYYIRMYSFEQLESMGENVKPHHQLKNTVTVDNSMGNDTTFLVTWQTSGPPEIELFEPNGGKYYTHNFIVNQALKTARLWIPGTAKVGVLSLFIMTPFSQVNDFQLNHIIKCIV